MNSKTTLKIILFISILILISAYFIEYILDYKPCNLCLYERLPYFFSITIIILNFSINKFNKSTYILLSIIFASGAILSFYHFGIEQGFFQESLACISNNDINSLTKEDIMKELQKNVVSCKDVQFTFLGFSLATINTIISLILSAITLKLFIKYEKN